MSSRPRKAIVAELFDEMEEVTAAVFVRYRCTTEDASEAARELRNELADLWGGQSIYFPRDAAKKSDEMRAQIVAEFDGTNVAALAKKWGISEVWVYKILRLDRAERVKASPLALVDQAPPSSTRSQASKRPIHHFKTLAERIGHKVKSSKG